MNICLFDSYVSVVQCWNSRWSIFINLWIDVCIDQASCCEEAVDLNGIFDWILNGIILTRILLPLNAKYWIFKYKKTTSRMWELKTLYRFNKRHSKSLAKIKMNSKVLTVFLAVLFAFAAGKFRLFLFVNALISTNNSNFQFISNSTKELWRGHR